MHVKICGLRSTAAVEAAISAGASHLGFVFFAKSPRHLGLAEAAPLIASVPPGVMRVALTVNADDATLADIASLGIDMFQLHGSESPERVEEVRRAHGLPVMKAVGIAGPEDLPALAEHGRAADLLLVDAKPPAGGALPGGNGLAFDWRLIAGRRWPVPWMLAGGLTPETVGTAIRLTGARMVDVSSGVESAPGVKDPARIAAFISAARAAWGL
ncbi:phosphoribosylanthranilate isomerase [Paroceanicella profunda]|uniref:N-(5'-phosphoribosyl)anthranilate isomerase n=1 Tax=Paroceanicella profunda TaxID=2579971 RepID=A0A5B8FGZ0_9RHOB|nr:phosphoribosylanthranilate isomerase [Paroceanicella profunda]QDL91577.1 phosphoribosylanthranilate isomerase [Paroceanicella profunda]